MEQETTDAGKEKIVITSALPYANGPIHIGHMVEYIQTDIFARFMKLIGEDAIYVCADDTHGTPIEISAKKEGILPEELISKYHQLHYQDFTDFEIEFDSYYSTNSEENKKYADYFFEKLKEKDLIYKKEMELTFCEHDNMFLPDRYVKGKCPKCNNPDQYGDVCEKCNATYSTVDLVEPYCTICGNTPIRKTSEHYFFKLGECQEKLKKWLTENENLQDEVKNYVLNWIKEGLRDWCISRDGPYFGFKIPGEENKYYYVWLDAPIGYISSTANYSKQNKIDVDDYWKRGKVIHFIGKDIIYFHFLFWPAMLEAADFRLPDDIVVHGFLTVNKEKMSKSRGTFLTAREYLDVLDPGYLRFYYAANLSRTISDIDLDLKDFKDKVNNELVADLGNFAYRVLSFTNKNFDGKITTLPNDIDPVINEVTKEFELVKKNYKEVNFREAVRHILRVGSIGNKYFQDNEPWKLIKEDPAKAQEVITFCVNLVKDIGILIKPILPKAAANVENQLNLDSQTWNDLNFSLENISIGSAEILFKKLEDEVDQLVPPEDEADKAADIDPFSKVDLRVGKIVDVKKHPNADKMYVEVVDLGDEKKQIVSGLVGHYDEDELADRNVIIVANLKPAKLRGVESEGMLLAAEDSDGKVKIIEPQYSELGAQVYVEGIESKPAEEITIDEFFKAKMKVVNHNVEYKGKPVKTAKETMYVPDIENGKVE